MENEVKKSASKVWLIPTIIAAVLLIGLVVFMVIMGKGTSALADGTVTLSEAVSPLQDGTAQLSDGVDQYTEGVDQVADGIEMLNENVPTLADGVQQLADGAVALNKGVNVGDKSLAAGMKSLASGVAGLDATLSAGLTDQQAADMKAAVAAEVGGQAKANRDKLVAASTQAMQQGVSANKSALVTGILADDSVAPVKAVVKAGILSTIYPSVQQGIDAMNTAGQFPYTWAQLVAAQGSEENALKAVWSNVGSTVITNVNTQYSAFGADFATDLAYDPFISGATDFVLELVVGGTIDTVNIAVVPVLAANAVDQAAAATLAACQEVAVTIANQTMATVRQGMVDGGLFDGVKALNAGVNGKDGLAEGVKKLQAGTAQLNEGVPTLTDGIKQLFDGSQQLKENSQALRDGASQLKDAAPALIDGIGQLVDGAKKVNGFTPIH